MAITINGTANTIAGIAAGGINDNVVDDGTLATNAVTNLKVADNAIDSAELVAGAVDIAHLSASGTAGNTTYLRGDNTWTVPPDTKGKILQAVHAETNSSTDLSATSSNVDITGMTLTYTPTSASSKIWVIAQINLRASAINTSYYGQPEFTLSHDVNDAEALRMTVGTGSGSSQAFIWPVMYAARFNANDTDSRVCKVKGRNINAGTGGSNNGHIVVNESEGKSQLWVLEVDES